MRRMMTHSLIPTVFLDRDGVIIENRPAYVRRWADVEIFPQALQALRLLSASFYRVVVVTNQSAIGRGLLTLEQVQAINQQLLTEVQRVGGRVDGVFLCPHAPEAQCLCRKPQPGLLLAAGRAWPVDWRRSWMIGDAWSDVLAGQAAGVGANVLVRTGRGKDHEAQQRPEGLGPVVVFDNLLAAVQHLLNSPPG